MTAIALGLISIGTGMVWSGWKDENFLVVLRDVFSGKRKLGDGKRPTVTPGGVLEMPATHVPAPQGAVVGDAVGRALPPAPGTPGFGVRVLTDEVIAANPYHGNPVAARPVTTR